MGTSPHDKLFRYTFEQPRRAAGYFELFLPEELVARLDLAAVELRPGSFVDEHLTERLSDLLFSVPWCGGRGDGSSEAFLYVLLEHQSTVDAFMPLRMLRYVVRIWDRWLEAHPGARGLPPVIPMVLSHDPRGWTAPTRMMELIDVEPRLLVHLERFIPTFELLLNDLSRRSDDELRLEMLSRLVLLLLKHRGEELLARWLPRWVEAFRELARAGAAGLQELRAVIEYILQASDISEAALGAFLATEVGAEAEEITMTTAERLRREGHRQGLEQGRQEGLQLGLRNVLTRLMTRQFGPLDEELLARIASATIEELEAWAERVLDAASPEEVLSPR